MYGGGRVVGRRAQAAGSQFELACTATRLQRQLGTRISELRRSCSGGMAHDHELKIHRLPGVRYISSSELVHAPAGSVVTLVRFVGTT